MAEGQPGGEGRRRAGKDRPAEGRRRAEPHRQAEAGAESAPRAHAVSLGIGVVLTAVAWFYLVRAAIDFGVAAVNGLVAAWLFTLGAALGAVVCLVLMLALVGRGLRSLGFISDYKPRRAGARRRH